MTRWRKAGDAELSWRYWDGEAVVYNDASGDTHHLDALAAEVLERLCTHAADVEEVSQAIANAYGLDPDDDLNAAVAGSVERFLKFGLIEPIPT